jgi:hypothetical protein
VSSSTVSPLNRPERLDDLIVPGESTDESTQKRPPAETGDLFFGRSVELAGIEPASFGAEPGLLRVQSVVVVFSVPALAQTRRRQTQPQKSPDEPLWPGLTSKPPR